MLVMYTAARRPGPVPPPAGRPHQHLWSALPPPSRSPSSLYTDRANPFFFFKRENELNFQNQELMRVIGGGEARNWGVLFLSKVRGPLLSPGGV